MAVNPKTGAAASSGALDRVKWAVVFLLVAAAIFGNWWLQDLSLLVRVLGVLGLAALAVHVLMQTVRARALWEMAKEAWAEIRRVVWPRRQETLSTTMIVLLTVLVFALMLWALDSVLSWFVQGLLG
ncbi:MAG: preprotein translocase subunit SecE [Pseudomonadales bacterium]|nr:preprotein translocase subunit SecE [Pseudomonadales bacterium]